MFVRGFVVLEFFIYFCIFIFLKCIFNKFDMEKKHMKAYTTYQGASKLMKICLQRIEMEISSLYFKQPAMWAYLVNLLDYWVFLHNCLHIINLYF